MTSSTKVYIVGAPYFFDQVERSGIKTRSTSILSRWALPVGSSVETSTSDEASFPRPVLVRHRATSSKYATISWCRAGFDCVDMY